jgi:ammonia channel protein AmtB
VQDLAEPVRSLEENVHKARKLIKRARAESFTALNSPPAVFFGTLLMWISLCFFLSGFSLNTVVQRYETEVAFLNCLVAGSVGGVTALFAKWVLSRRNQSRIDQGKSAVNLYLSGSSLTLDTFSLSRGIIAGCIAVSGGAIHYKVWISPLLGAAGGMTYVVSCIILHKFKLDDPLEIFQTHGAPALVALISIIFFDKDEGLFFKADSDISEEGSDAVMIVLGANVLGIMMIITWTSIFSSVFYILIKRRLLRVSRTTETMGSDVW